MLEWQVATRHYLHYFLRYIQYAQADGALGFLYKSRHPKRLSSTTDSRLDVTVIMRSCAFAAPQLNRVYCSHSQVYADPAAGFITDLVVVTVYSTKAVIQVS